MLRVRCLRGGSRGAEAVHYIGSRVRFSTVSGPGRDSGWGPRERLDSPVRRPWRGVGSVAREGVLFWEDACGWMDGATGSSCNTDPPGLQGSRNESILSPTCCSALPSASLGCPERARVPVLAHTHACRLSLAPQQE